MSARRVPVGRMLAGSSVLGLMLAAAPAFAAGECGAVVAGAVTCSNAGNPYAAGITYAANPGNITVTSNADVVVNSTLTVSSTAGTASVVSNGTVATSAASTDGIDLVAPGNVAVAAASVSTSGANSAGINATSTGGTVTVNASNVAVGANGGAGILVLSAGAASVTSGTASAQNESAIFVRSQTGPVTININGNTSAAAGSDAAVTAISGSTIAITVAVGATVAGTNALVVSPQGAAAVTIVNNGTLTGGNGFGVLAKFGTTTVTNNGTINGGVEFAGAGSSLVNNGTVNLSHDSIFGTGAGGTLVNSGTVNLVSGAGPSVTSSATLYALASFSSSGKLNLANGHAGDVLTVSGGFAGSGASALVLDVGAGSTVDKLVIGGAATGVTSVRLVNVAGSGGLLNPGTAIVTTGAGTLASAFQLAASSTQADFIQYAVAFNAATNTFTLSAAPTTAAYRPLVYQEGARNLWYKVSDAWQAHMRSLRQEDKARGGLWGQLYGATDTRHDAIATNVFGQSASQDLSYRQDVYGMQLGADASSFDGKRGGTFGITAGYLHSTVQFLGQSARTEYNVFNFGGYAGQRFGALFVNLLGQYSHASIRSSDAAIGLSQKLGGNNYGITFEAGTRLDGHGFFVEPIATLSYVHTRLGQFSAFASTFDYNGSKGWRGKLGARFATEGGTDGQGLSVYGGANAVKAFRGSDSLVFTNNSTAITFGDNRVGFYGEGYAGLSFASGHIKGFLEGFGEYGGSDTMRGGGVRIGVTLHH